jgi:hypothetical protein
MKIESSGMAKSTSNKQRANDFYCRRAQNQNPTCPPLIEGWVSRSTDAQPSSDSTTYNINSKTCLFPYSEHLGPAHGTCALSGWPAVLHDYALGIPHLPLGTALHTVCLHLFTSLFFKG